MSEQYSVATVQKSILLASESVLELWINSTRKAIEITLGFALIPNSSVTVLLLIQIEMRIYRIFCLVKIRAHSGLSSQLTAHVIRFYRLSGRKVSGKSPPPLYVQWNIDYLN